MYHKYRTEALSSCSIMRQTHPLYQQKQLMRRLKNATINAVLLLALLIMHSTPVSCSSTAAGKSWQTTQPQHQHKPTMWGVLPNVESSSNVNLRNHAALTSAFPKHIIVMGGPASGKGTQCQAIAEKHGLVHLSTGDMLRQSISSESSDGEASPHISSIKKCMENGKLIPDDIIVRLVLDRLRSPDCQKQGWILDGFPRTANQARALKSAGIHPDLFLFLNVPDELAIKRACGRRTDPLTGRVYHLDWNLPPNKTIEQRLTVRSDDTVESMKQRLKQFRENANAVKGCYSNIAEIDGIGTPDEVLNEILSSIKFFIQRKQSS